MASGVGCPVSATFWYIAHSDGRNRPQAVDDAPLVKKMPAQAFLKTPFAAPFPVGFSAGAFSAGAVVVVGWAKAGDWVRSMELAISTAVSLVVM